LLFLLYLIHVLETSEAVVNFIMLSILKNPSTKSQQISQNDLFFEKTLIVFNFV